MGTKDTNKQEFNMSEHEKHRMKQGSLQTFDELRKKEEFKTDQAAILSIIEDNPNQTKNELLNRAIELEYTKAWNSNWIAPKLNMLMKKGLIIRPKRRLCTVTGEINYIHRKIPMSWSEERSRLLSEGVAKKNLVLDWMETESKTKPDTIHTTIMWYDESISCTCNEEYSRSPEFRCHHAKGMYEAKTGKRIGEPDYKEEYERLTAENESLTKRNELLLSEVNRLNEAIEQLKEMYG